MFNLSSEKAQKACSQDTQTENGYVQQSKGRHAMFAYF